MPSGPHPQTDSTKESTKEQPLESWKEIANYVQRNVRTAKRWEDREGLPVHRHRHQARSSVYAYSSELDAWRASRNPAAEPSPPPAWSKPLTSVAFVLVLLLSLISVGNGPRFGPEEALAEERSGIVVRQVWNEAEADFHGGPSPQGAFLSYSHWETGNLALHDLETGENRRLTNDGNWNEPVQFAYKSVVSPEGDRVAYSFCCPEGHYDLRVVGVGTGPGPSEPVIVYANDQTPYLDPIGWTADGKEILTVFETKENTSQLAFVSVENGAVRVLKSFGWSWPQGRISPDGNYIAYDFPPREDAKQRDIFVLAADGSRETTLVDLDGEDLMLGWAPDSSSVLFASNRTGDFSAWLIDVRDGKPSGLPQLIKRNLGGVQPMGLTASGAFYYGVSSGMKDIYLATLDPATGNAVGDPKLASRRFMGANVSPAWSPDGSRLAYFSMRQASNDLFGVPSLVFLSLETGRERVLSWEFRTDARMNHLRWAPDGKSLLATAPDAKARWGLVEIDVETGVVNLLAIDRPGSRPIGVWSLDGKRIFYTSNLWPRTDASEIRVRDLESGEEQVLYRDEDHPVGNLALSPDGSQLAFGRSELANVLYVMPVAGGSPKTVLEIKGAYEEVGISGLAWSRDGRYLYYNKLGRPESELWRVSISGGAPEKLGLSGFRWGSVRVHPEGDRIAYVAGQWKTDVWVMENFLPDLAAAR